MQQRSLQRDTLLRHVVQVAYTETDRLRPAWMQGPLSDDQLQQFDRLLAAADRIRGDYDSRACAFLRAQRARLTGDDEGYQALQARAAEIAIDSPSESYLEAVRLMTARQWGDALELLTTLADRDGIPSGLRWTMMGRNLYNAGQYEEAKLSITQSIEHAPRASRLWYMRGLCYHRLEEYARAESDFDRTIELEPTFVPAWLQRGVCRLTLGRMDEGVADLTKGLELSPGHAKILINRSEAYRELGRMEEADQDMQEAIHSQNVSPASLYYRGKKLMKIDPVQALADFQQSFLLDPDLVSALTHAARTLSTKLGKPEEALQILDRVIELDPDNETATIDRSVLLAQLGRRREALRDLQEALKPPNHDRTLYQAACTNALLNRPRMAVTRLAQAIQNGYKADNAATDEDLEVNSRHGRFPGDHESLLSRESESSCQRTCSPIVTLDSSLRVQQFATSIKPHKCPQMSDTARQRRPIFNRWSPRRLLAAFGTPWPEPRDLTISFPADGVQVGTYSNDIRETLDQVADRQQWEELALRALQTWSIHADINVGLRNDYDLDFGTPGLAVSDPRFGDFRIGAFPQTGLVASSVPFQTDAGTYSGDLLLNSNEQFKYHNWENGVAPDPSTLGPDDRDLFSILLHESGNTLGLDDNLMDWSVMFRQYTVPKGVLTAQDINDIQALYGARTDPYELTDNGQLQAATLIPAPIGFDLAAAVIRTRGSLINAADVDHYEIIPIAGQDTATIRLNASGISLLNARIEILNSQGRVLKQAQAASVFENDSTLHITELGKHAVIYVRVTAADPNDVYSVGDYELEIDYRAAAIQAADPVAGNYDAGADSLFANFALVDSEIGLPTKRKVKQKWSADCCPTPTLDTNSSHPFPPPPTLTS